MGPQFCQALPKAMRGWALGSPSFLHCIPPFRSSSSSESPLLSCALPPLHSTVTFGKCESACHLPLKPLHGVYCAWVSPRPWKLASPSLVFPSTPSPPYQDGPTFPQLECENVPVSIHSPLPHPVRFPSCCFLQASGNLTPIPSAGLLELLSGQSPRVHPRS